MQRKRTANASIGRVIFHPIDLLLHHPTLSSKSRNADHTHTQHHCSVYHHTRKNSFKDNAAFQTRHIAKVICMQKSPFVEKKTLKNCYHTHITIYKKTNISNICEQHIQQQRNTFATSKQFVPFFKMKVCMQQTTYVLACMSKISRQHNKISNSLTSPNRQWRHHPSQILDHRSPES